MKAVILAGGFGTRISEETTVRPKPMVEIGEKPILWHIMKSYDSHGIREFIICCGYKGFAIKEYFANYLLHTSDVTIDLRKEGMDIHRSGAEDWRVTVIDTGLATMTGYFCKEGVPGSSMTGLSVIAAVAFSAGASGGAVVCPGSAFA